MVDGQSRWPRQGRRQRLSAGATDRSEQVLTFCLAQHDFGVHITHTLKRHNQREEERHTGREGKGRGLLIFNSHPSIMGSRKRCRDAPANVKTSHCIPLTSDSAAGLMLHHTDSPADPQRAREGAFRAAAAQVKITFRIACAR